MELVKQCEIEQHKKGFKIVRALFGLFTEEGFTGVREELNKKDSFYIEGRYLTGEDESEYSEKVYFYLESIKIGLGEEWLSLGILHTKKSNIYTNDKGIQSIQLTRANKTFDIEVVPHLMVSPKENQVNLHHLFKEYFIDLLKNSSQVVFYRLSEAKTDKAYLSLITDSVWSAVADHTENIQAYLFDDYKEDYYLHFVNINFKAISFHLDRLGEHTRMCYKEMYLISFSHWFKMNTSQIISKVIKTIQGVDKEEISFKKFLQDIEYMF